MQENAGVGAEPVGLDGARRAVRTYLSERFPVFLAVPVLSGYVCCYILYEQASGHQAFSWAT